ncbi:hypothetical protein [Streptomyces sp. G-G2]|uniref:hypothetical protein n=1 Tax=Streptomyces sp. G-G2 TaxID=3046201 RepID=UPI0024B8C414|nr:hypothetical protein [Streptomyces sp. G-G2]MDJ0384695.1 hypothetical protein [Streptomyces sp. G-G2]
MTTDHSPAGRSPASRPAAGGARARSLPLLLLIGGVTGALASGALTYDPCGPWRTPSSSRAAL